MKAGTRVRATITDLSTDSGERVITGTIVEVLNTQFIVQEDLRPDHKTHYPFDTGYRFIMNKGEWEEIK